MKSNQLQELIEMDETDGIDLEVKKQLNKIDKDGKIKPHFSIKPVLFMVVDNVELNEENYQEYAQEYL